MKSSTITVVAGTVALTIGVAALIFPFVFGLAVTLLVGWGFILSGALGMWGAFSDKGLLHRGWVFFFGAVEVVLGVWMLANPFQGLVSLTLLAGILLVFSGLARLLVARRVAGATFWLLALSGVVSAGLGIYALFQPLIVSPILIGTLLAVELISVGVTLLAFGIVLKRKTDL